MEPLLDDLLERLGSHLVWRIGKAEEEEVLVVRLGLASSTPHFASYPRLRNASDEEVEKMVKAGQVRLEWVD